MIVIGTHHNREKFLVFWDPLRRRKGSYFRLFGFTKKEINIILKTNKAKQVKKRTIERRNNSNKKRLIIAITTTKKNRNKKTIKTDQ